MSCDQTYLASDVCHIYTIFSKKDKYVCVSSCVIDNTVCKKKSILLVKVQPYVCLFRFLIV